VSIQNFRKPEEERLLWIPKHRWEYNIKMGLKQMGCEGEE